MILDGSDKYQETFTLRNLANKKLYFGGKIIYLTPGAFVEGPRTDKSLSLKIHSTMRSGLVKSTYSGASLLAFESQLFH